MWEVGGNPVAGPGALKPTFILATDICHIIKKFVTLQKYLPHYINICHITKICFTLPKYISHYQNIFHITKKYLPHYKIFFTLHKYLSHYQNIFHITKLFVTLPKIFVTLSKYLSNYKNVWHITKMFVALQKYLSPYKNIFQSKTITSHIFQQICLGVCRVGAPGAQVFGHGCHTILLDMVQRQVDFKTTTILNFKLYCISHILRYSFGSAYHKI